MDVIYYLGIALLALLAILLVIVFGAVILAIMWWWLPSFIFIPLTIFIWQSGHDNIAVIVGIAALIAQFFWYVYVSDGKG